MPTLKSRFDLARHFASLGFKVGAEIGVAAGDYSEALCKHIPGLELYCIDPWQRYEDNPRGGSAGRQANNLQTAVEKLRPYNTHIIQLKSMDALGAVKDESLDFVFIDGHHDYEYIKDDLVWWSTKVRKGGIVSGHDYYHFDKSGVVEAVDWYAENTGQDLNIIPEDPRRSKRDDTHPCWWWVKP